MYKPMPDAKIRYIKYLYGKGMTIPEIADLLNCTVKTIDFVIYPDHRKKPERKQTYDPEIYASTNPNCKKCRYRVSICGESGPVMCYYIVRKRERRGCPVKGCTRFEEGTPERDVAPIVARGRDYDL